MRDATSATRRRQLTRRCSQRPVGERAEQPLTVIQVTWSFVAGGSEMYAFTVASHLDPQKYRSVMCALDRGGTLAHEIEEAGIQQFVMHRRPGIRPSVMWQMYRLFRNARVDVVHTHHFNQLLYCAIGARLAGARLIHTEHCSEDLGCYRYRITMRVLSRLCDRIVAIGSGVARTLVKGAGVPAHKLALIAAGIDTEAFNHSRKGARQQLGLSETERIATIVARLSPEKNHRLLVAAFGDVAGRLPGSRLLIVGDGVEAEAIRQEISNLRLEHCVQMMGVRRDIPLILAATDVFVLSSDSEGLPIAVLEAMAAARPVVVTAVGDLPSLVRAGLTGLVVPRRDRSALARALTDMLGDTERAAQMGVNARQFVQQHYSLHSMIDRHQELYALCRRTTLPCRRGGQE